MHFTEVMLLFWAAGLIAHVLLVVVLYTRHRAKTFPFFTALITTNIVNSIALYEIALHGTKRSYFIAYFSFAILDFALQLSVTYELATHVFCPTGTWAPDVRSGFLILVIASIIIAALLAGFPAPPEKLLLGTLLDRGNLFTSALQCELFVGMLALSVTARLPWKTHVARIAQGLGFYSLIDLLTEAGHSVVVRNTVAFESLTYIGMTIYLVCALYWIVMLWMEAPAPQELPKETRRQLFTLQRRVEYDLRKLRSLK